MAAAELRALALALLLAAARARKFSGAVGGGWPSWPLVIGRFSFGFDPSNQPVGSATVTYSYGAAAPAVESSVVMFDDTLWAQAYGPPSMSCVQATQTQWPAGSTGFAALALPNGASGPATESFIESARPHVWYFTLAANDCSSPALVSYTIDLRLADGSQLGYDEIGMPAIFGVFWFFNTAGLAWHVWAHYFRAAGAQGGGGRFAPALVRFYTASLVLFSSTCFFHMIEWSALAADGVGSPAVGFVGDFARIGSLMCLWIVCAMAATGYGIVTYHVDEKNWNWLGWLLLAAMLCAYLGLVIVFIRDQDPNHAFASDLGSVWPALSLLGLTCAYAAWWYMKIRATHAAEVNTTKKLLLRRLTYALGANFFVLPFAFFLGAVTPLWERTRITTGFDIFIISCINAAVAWALWPSNAQEAFRVYDGSTAIAMLAMGGSGEEGVGGAGDFHSALDQAYSYSDMASNPRGAAASANAYVPVSTTEQWKGSL